MIDSVAQHPASSLVCCTLGPTPREFTTPLASFHVVARFGTSLAENGVSIASLEAFQLLVLLLSP